MLTATALLVIVLTVGAAGAGLAALLDARGAHLVTVSGAPSRLVLARVAIWSLALLVGVAAWFVVSWAMPSMVALGVFFGIEAGLLDICANRIAFVPAPRPAVTV
ncbi:MAG: hypothetical protein QJR03_01960 [Sphaerobacter sp.]|nr:hypothetical protein [Sphaerobacter sp.]